MLKQLQLDIHYTFSQVKLLETALTHSSYVNELAVPGEHNERLEFLGDAVLELNVSFLLYSRFPGKNEGELTVMRSQLVNRMALADMAQALHLGSYLKLGKGEELQGGRERTAILEDTFEAVLGAVYLDGGEVAAHSLVERLFGPKIDAVQLLSCPGKDYKSALQEQTQKMWQLLPLYTLESSDGPEHARSFRVRVTCGERLHCVAEGKSIKKAEQAAAAKALTFFE